MANRIKWCLLGIPDHEAVKNLGGRLGAVYGPSAFWAAFRKFKGMTPVHACLAAHETLSGLQADVRTNLESAANAVARLHGTHDFSIVVGGSHDHGFSHLLGLRRALGGEEKLACINFDAHLDVRRPDPAITSGSPFYLAITENVIAGPSLIEFGIQSHCNGPELWEFAKTHTIPVIPFSDLRSGRAVARFKEIVENLAKTHDLIALSLDLDAFAECHAPGVSAPQAEGFAPAEVIEMLEWAATIPQVASLGIFELNPIHDIDGRTARLAATCAYHFAESRLRSE